MQMGFFQVTPRWLYPLENDVLRSLSIHCSYIRHHRILQQRSNRSRVLNILFSCSYRYGVFWNSLGWLWQSQLLLVRWMSGLFKLLQMFHQFYCLAMFRWQYSENELLPKYHFFQFPDYSLEIDCSSL